MFDADIGGNLALELGDFRAEYVFAAFDDAVDRRPEAVAKPFALRANVEGVLLTPVTVFWNITKK